MQGGGVIFETPSPYSIMWDYVLLIMWDYVLLILKESSLAFELSCKYS